MELIRILRVTLQLTQKELADRVGCDASFISLLESGKRDILETEYQVVIRLAREFNQDPDVLFPVPLGAPMSAVKGAA